MCIRYWDDKDEGEDPLRCKRFRARGNTLSRLPKTGTLTHRPDLRLSYAKDSSAVLTMLLLLVAAPTAAPATPSSPLAEPDVAHMSPKDIKTFNQSVPLTHPYHIRCVRSIDTGSLIRSSNVCKTNQQWAAFDRIGNENARETTDAMKGKGVNTN